jgi:hypothetical protein
MPTQKYLPVLLPSHYLNSTPQPISIPASAARRRRPMWTFPPKWQIESQNREPRLRQSIRHLHQKFRLAIRPSPMRKHNRLSAVPRSLVYPATNANLTTNIFKRYRHDNLCSNSNN